MTNADSALSGVFTVESELVEVIEALALTQTAAQVFDSDGRLAWASEQLLILIGVDPDAEIGLGQRVEEGMRHAVWRSSLTPESVASVRDELTRRLDPATDHPPMWVAPIELRLPGRRLSIGMLGATLHARNGRVLGTALVYAAQLPARVLARVAEGDEAMLIRMADLAVPGQRRAAVLFADLDASAVLSRRLSTPAYFELIRGVTTAFDDLVGQYAGITGKHAGDGASAFFLAETYGSDSAAAHAALATARALPGAVRAHATGSLGTDLDGIDPRINIGVHWGANVYIGQVVTGGRLEVTALGDEVNECARIENVAAGGQTLASKALLERLDTHAAAQLGLGPYTVTYRMLAELREGDPKVLRDAATIAVTDLAERG